MSLELWIPQSARGARFRCHLCEGEWPEHQRSLFLGHMKKCVKRHEGEIDGLVASQRDPAHGATAFTTHLDPEKYHYERRRAVDKKLKGIKGVD